jgi:hypothetical protein
MEPWVALLDAEMFIHTCSLDGSHCFLLNLTPEPWACAASALADLVDLKDIPKEYHDFTDSASQKLIPWLPTNPMILKFS